MDWVAALYSWRRSVTLTGVRAALAAPLMVASVAGSRHAQGTPLPVPGCGICRVRCSQAAGLRRWYLGHERPRRSALFPSSLVDVDANIERPKVRGVAACTPEPCLILHPTCDAGTDQPSSDRSLRLCWRQCIIAPADRSRTCNFARWRKGFRTFFGIFSIVCACMGKSRDDSERGHCSP